MRAAQDDYIRLSCAYGQRLYMDSGYVITSFYRHTLLPSLFRRVHCSSSGEYIFMFNCLCPSYSFGLTDRHVQRLDLRLRVTRYGG